ncbi:putative holin-like toxin [Fictibacillus nanhaiensis]|uniref:putative holin-like toxin n=1 Tax=Fictibacillus nanhaiensis TaxID=742169 RepID=UPI003C1C5AD0
MKTLYVFYSEIHQAKKTSLITYLSLFRYRTTLLLRILRVTRLEGSKMTVFETMSLMISFSMLIVTILHSNNRSR